MNVSISKNDSNTYLKYYVSIFDYEGNLKSFERLSD